MSESVVIKLPRETWENILKMLSGRYMEHRNEARKIEALTETIKEQLKVGVKDERLD